MTEQDLQRRTVLTAVGWLAVVVVGELITGRSPDVVVSPLYGLAPLIACAALPWTLTAALGLVAILLSVASGIWTGTLETEQHLIRMVTVALTAVAAVYVADMRERRDQRFRRVARIADVAQRSILPIVPPRVGPVRTATRYVPAVQDTLVGGDLFDCFSSEQHTCFVVGDVRGKGVGAIEQAARVIRAFRQAAAASTDLAAIAADMSTYLVPFLDEEEFATAVLVQVRDGEHFTVVSCGHPPPLLVDPAGQGRLVEAPAGFPLGLDDDYLALDVPWSAGDRLLLYTDGLSEVRDVDGQFLPVAPMARQLVGHDVDESLERLLTAVRERAPSKNATDDLALVLIENVGVVQPVRRRRPVFARRVP